MRKTLTQNRKGGTKICIQNRYQKEKTETNQNHMYEVKQKIWKARLTILGKRD